MWPAGVLVDDHDHAVGARYVYPETDYQFFACCWLGPTATFRTRAPRDASTLRFDVTVPALKPFKGRTENVRVSVSGIASATYRGLTVGDHVLVLPLPKRHSPTVQVDMQLSYAWEPDRWKITNDSRMLSVQLRGVRAK